MRVARRVKFASLMVAALAVPATLVVGTAGTASATSACNTTAADSDSSSWPRQTAGVSANMRSGAHTACGIKGYADNQNTLDYHCWTSGENGTWTYLRNDTDGTYGWVKDSLLPGNGSNVWCGF